MKLSPKRAENLSIASLLLNLLFFFLAIFFDKFSGSSAVGVVGWLYLGSLPIWLVLIIQFRQKRLAEQESFEAQEYRRLNKEGRAVSVFDNEIDSELLIQQRRLEWIEKWLLPTCAIIVSAYLITIGIWQWSIVKEVKLSLAGDMSLKTGMDLGKTIVTLAGMGIISFLLSCYTVGMSRQDVWRPLRSGGIYMFAGTISSLIVAGALAGTAFSYYKPLIIIGKVLVGFILLLGIEMALLVTLDIFRPRIKGQYQQTSFESRLLGIFGGSGSFFRTASHALDYQFGFKVSETWFYRLLEKYIAMLLIIDLAILYLATSFCIVPTGSKGVCERWGAPMNLDEPWSAGMHFKLPYPIEQVRIFPVSETKIVDVGYERKDSPVNPVTGQKMHDYTPVLWTIDHWKQEYPFLVPAKKAGMDENDSDAVNNLFDKLVVAVVFQYHIEDIKKYAYQSGSFIEPASVISKLCERAVLHYCSQNDIEQILGPGRDLTAKNFKKNINETLNNYGVGVKVDFVGIKSVHPPVKVAESFEKVISALQQKQTSILMAQGFSEQIINNAEAEADVAVSQAKAYKKERQLLAEADSKRFIKQIEAYDKGKDVYLKREYLSVLDEEMPKLRKYIIASDNVDDWVYEFDLKEVLKPDMLQSLGAELESQKK